MGREPGEVHAKDVERTVPGDVDDGVVDVGKEESGSTDQCARHDVGCGLVRYSGSDAYVDIVFISVALCKDPVDTFRNHIMRWLWVVELGQ